MLDSSAARRWAPLQLIFIFSLRAPSLSAQVTLKQIAVPSPDAPATAPPTFVSATPKTSARIPEGTEIRVQLEELLSSATAQAGDTFTITTVDQVQLADGTVIPSGYRGKGEVSQAHRREMLGKAGELDIRLDYIRIGDTRVRLRANKSSQGRSNLTTTVVLSLLVTPLFLLVHGHEMVIPRGTPVTGYVDEDATIALPIAPPPKDD